MLAESATSAGATRTFVHREHLEPHHSAHHVSHILPTPCAALGPLRSPIRPGAINPTLNCRHRVPAQHTGFRNQPSTSISREQMHINTSPATRANSAEGAQIAIATIEG